VEELEVQLATSEIPLVASSSPVNQSSITAREDEDTVDAIATNAFNETPQYDVGYFGTT
jgi:hypothetical protein